MGIVCCAAYELNTDLSGPFVVSGWKNFSPTIQKIMEDKAR